MLITNFSSGELSPLLNGRVDLQMYYQSAARIENFEIVPTGGIKRRVGMKRLAQIDKDSRIIPFILNKDNVFVFQAYAYKLNIWKLAANGNLLLLQSITFTLPTTQPTEDNFFSETWYYKDENNNYVKATEYDSTKTYYFNYFNFSSLAEVREIQYAQNYDTLVLTHRYHRPLIMEYDFTKNLFDCSVMYFNVQPNVVLDDDFDFVMLPVTNLPTCIKTKAANGYYEFQYYEVAGTSATPVTKSYNESVTECYCIFENHLYKYGSSNAWVQIGDDADVEDVFSSESNYPGCVAFFNNRLWFASSILKQQKIWASATPDGTGTRYNDFSTYTKYVTVNKVIKDADLHIFTCDVLATDVDTTQHKTTLRNVSQDFTNGLQKSATDYFITGDNIPAGTKVLSITSNTITINTSNMSVPTEGLTNQVCSIQLWHNASTPDGGDYEYLVVNNNITRADNSFNFEVASDENDAIKFLSSNKFLAAGTESSIWSIAAGSNANEITAVMQGRYGSDDLPGMTVATATIYLAQGKKGIREFYFDSQSEAFQTNNIAIMAEQMLTESPAIDMDYMTNPYNRILITRADGTVVSLLYDKNNGVMGWNRMTRASGAIRDVAITRGEEESDYLFFVVKDGQDTDGNDLFYIEMIDAGQKVYLDSWKVYANSTAGYTNDAYLYNKTKDKLCSITDIPADFIATGDTVYIGYLIKSYIKSMPVLNSDPNEKKRIVSLIIRFLESEMPVLKVTGLPDENFYAVETPYSGVKEITYPGQSDRDVHFELETKSAKDVCILAVNAKIV